MSEQKPSFRERLAAGEVVVGTWSVIPSSWVTEAQDIGVPQLRLLGDLGQRIFQTPYSWLALGVDVRGRSHTLRINYRNSHQIRRHADRLLPAEMADVDGNTEQRSGTQGSAMAISVRGDGKLEAGCDRRRPDSAAVGY